MTTPIDADALRKELSRNWFKLAAIALSLTVLASLAYIAYPALLTGMSEMDLSRLALSILELGLDAATWLYTNHVLYGACLALLVLSKFYAARACTALLPLGGSFDHNKKETALEGLKLAKKAQTLTDGFMLSILLHCMATVIFSMQKTNYMPEYNPELVLGFLFASVMLFTTLAATPLVQPAYLRVKSVENTEFWTQMRNAYWSLHGVGSDWFSDIAFVQCIAVLAKKRLKELHD